LNGTDNRCEFVQVEVASCPEEPALTRECCFSGNEGVQLNCDLSPVPAGFTSLSYVYKVEGLGAYTFATPGQSLPLILQMTATATALNPPATQGIIFMSPQVGTNTTSVVIPPEFQTITTGFADSVGPLTSGDPRFDYLQGSSSFVVLLSATLGESGGDATRTSTLEGCMDFTFVV